jgi:hypothetical protein
MIIVRVFVTVSIKLPLGRVMLPELLRNYLCKLGGYADN